MASDYNESPYKQYCEPDFNTYYLDIDGQTREEIKLYRYIKKEEFQSKIPSYYRYLYVLRKEVYELLDSVIYYPGDTRYYAPTKRTYGQHGKVFTIKIDAVTFRDKTPFIFQRNFNEIRVPLD